VPADLADRFASRADQAEPEPQLDTAENLLAESEVTWLPEVAAFVRRAHSAEQRFQLLMALTDRLAELVDSEG
jgi:hypothetical protein